MSDDLRREREKEFLYWLCQIPVFGAVKIRRLWETFQSFEAVYNIEGTYLTEKGLLKAEDGRCFDQYKKYLQQTTRDYRQLSRKGIRFVTILDEDYPGRLLHIYDYPMGLYVRGSLPQNDAPAVAVIGARNCSSYGMQVAERIGEVLGREGVQVISGMALGIDGAGHQGALKAGGSTFAVLGSGVDVCYPKKHWNMYNQIPAQGGVISECRLGQQPLSKYFPMRNRLISGMSDAIVVVEARERSGSLITVELGLEQGKEIFAVPGMITDQLSAGCNHLIKQGANILTAPQDILEYFQIKEAKKLRVDEKFQIGLAKNEKMVYSCLDFQPKFFDQVVEESGLPMDEVMTLLLELEWKGFVLQPVNHYYVKKL